MMEINSFFESFSNPDFDSEDVSFNHSNKSESLEKNGSFQKGVESDYSFSTCDFDSNNLFISKADSNIKKYSEKSKDSSKSLSDSDLAELLIDQNIVVELDGVLYYWSDFHNHYIPLIGEKIDQFIRSHTPDSYKKKINQRSISEIIQWMKVSKNIDKGSISNSQRYIAFQNGVYDITENQLLEHDQCFYSLNIIQTDYPENNLFYVSGEHFERFMSDITNDDMQLYDRIQELFGYVLSNIRNIKCIPFLVGAKDTGKSIVLRLLEYLIGENSVTHLSFDQLNTPVFLAELIGKKLNTCGELGEFKFNRLDVFKKLSGGDSLLAKPIYEKPVSFKNSAALVFAGNHLPMINGLDKANAFSNRLLIFPFMHPVEKENQDIFLFEKLKDESSYIVRWAIYGLQRWIDNNYEFTSCELIEELSKNYAEQNNSIENFLNDWCFYDSSAKVFRYELESYYHEYCNDKGLTPVALKELHAYLKMNISLSHKRFRKNTENKYGYIGIGLKQQGGIDNEFTS